MGTVEPLFGGWPLAEWARAGGPPERHVRALSARLRWHSYWFENNLRMQTKRVEPVALPKDPVFILGMWRSGTTVLHELLTACTGWLTPQTWQCFNPSTCFLTGPPARQSAAKRPMDHGQIATSGPQEDEFATLLLGEPSAYRGFIDPRRLDESAALLRGGDSGLLPRWQDFLRGIASAGSGTRVILKSPNHTFRLPLLRALFPRAQFIWIGRHSGEVLASNLKMWRMMMDHYALWNCPPGALEHFLREALSAYTDVLARTFDELQSEQMLWIDFEKLRDDPRDQLERVMRFVQPDRTADSGVVSQKLDQALASVPIHAGTRATLPTDVDARRLEHLMAAARRRFG
jgi:hypothetical protein